MNNDQITELGLETRFKGNIKFRNSLHINGLYEGQIDSPGFLYIEEKAHVAADIKVGSVVIAGTVQGDIEAEGSVVMKSSAYVVGNIKASVISIDDGVHFEGQCDMISEPGMVDIFSAGVEQLKKSVRGDLLD